MDWLAFCLTWKLGAAAPEVELRVGMGRYDNARHLHVRVDAPARGALSASLHDPIPTLPLPPMRQFLRCGH